MTSKETLGLRPAELAKRYDLLIAYRNYIEARAEHEGGPLRGGLAAEVQAIDGELYELDMLMMEDDERSTM